EHVVEHPKTQVAHPELVEVREGERPGHLRRAQVLADRVDLVSEVARGLAHREDEVGDLHRLVAAHRDYSARRSLSHFTMRSATASARRGQRTWCVGGSPFASGFQCQRFTRARGILASMCAATWRGTKMSPSSVMQSTGSSTWRTASSMSGPFQLRRR